MTVWPVLSLPISALDGFWTRSTTSAVLYRSAVETTVAPTAVYAESGNADPSPAPDSTSTSTPALTSLLMTSGTTATRRSRGAVSFAMATFIQGPRYGGMGTQRLGSVLRFFLEA